MSESGGGDCPVGQRNLEYGWGYISRVIRKGGWYSWKPSSSSNFSIRVGRVYPLIKTRQAVPCRAIRGNSISVNSTPLLIKYLCPEFVLETTGTVLYFFGLRHHLTTPNTTTTWASKDFWSLPLHNERPYSKDFGSCFPLGVRAIFWVVNHRTSLSVRPFIASVRAVIAALSQSRFIKGGCSGNRV